MITAVKISEDLKSVVYEAYEKGKRIVGGEKLDKDNKDYWLDLYCKLQNY